MYAELSQTEKNRFRARKSYWKRKGLSEKEAIERAETHSKEYKLPKGFGTSRLERKLVSVANTADVSRNIEKVTKIHSDLTHSSKCGQIFRASLLLLATTATTILLVESSLESLGSDWTSWLKAILLEFGILVLAVSKTQVLWKYEWGTVCQITHLIISKGTLIFLLTISFTVLHSGVESQRSDGLQTAKSNSENIIELVEERNDWRRTYESYPENRITDRRNAMVEISRLNSEIKTERLSVSQSLDGRVIELKSNNEMMMRAALLLLNIIFGHKLVSVLTTIRWPPLREERLVSYN